VDIDLGKALGGRYAKEFIDVVKGRMDTTVRGKAHQMQLFAGRLDIVEGRTDLLVFEEPVLAAGDIDLHKVLIDHPAGAEIHMADLGIAHLAVRKAHIFAAGLKVGTGILGAKCVDIRCTLGPYSVGIIVAALTPAVQNHKKNFSVHNYIQ
jgi:hypothetical protein